MSYLRSGEFYDQQHQKLVEDIPFFLSRVEHYGDPVLELACGTGRVTIPLAQAGFKITGLDINNSMLQQAKKKAENQQFKISWQQGDMRCFQFAEKFKTIIIPFNSLSLFTEDDLHQVLSCIKKNLHSQGHFIADIFNPDLGLLNRDPSQQHFLCELTDPHSKERIIVKESNKYDRAQQVNYITIYYQSSANVCLEKLNMRIIYPQELKLLLKWHGLVVKEIYGNYNLEPFHSKSPKQLVVCQHQ